MREELLLGVFVGLVACGGSDSDSSGDSDGGGGNDTDGAPEAGSNELVGVMDVDGVATTVRCTVGVTPATSAELTSSGTRRVRLACLELVGSKGMNMFSVLVERDADYVVGASPIGNETGSGTGDTLAVVLTDENGDGFQYTTSGSSGFTGWSGELRLDEIGPEGGGTVRGSLTASWDDMQEMADAAPTGDPVPRPGTLAVSFDFTRP